ncbi:phosphotransferase enzyme family protein [Streptomyces rishiriensis]|uniref:Ser/Thr protein kinase RdoA (MazF antagonist) n=1 Tax=Streptomyces rishiriensis TaxID=68264 RepID=A0ABU0P039_STRRH|nr:phosphotransferase [Streptomyces rishiriensis]MDQ0584766.1 Ser/Thr protein kinase RdoA (MazF antagonist) [Streptomyces rishiriensis]
MSSHLAHGLGTDPVEPDWAPLTDDEVTDVVGVGARVMWRSPRPLSAAAVVERDGRRLFVKRHHVRVRSPEGLAEEHAFLRHLREHGAPVVEVLDAAVRGTWTYEVHSTGAGEDLYRDALSWSPFRSPTHATAAGEALARLHLAARGFDAPRRQAQPLVASFTVFAAQDPWDALERYVHERPQLASGLGAFPWREDTRRVLLPLHERLAPHLPGLEPLWTHNDWHASNLLWDRDGQVRTVLDFGMSDRTTAVHDLATAIERNTVQWLRPGYPVREDDVIALVDGYRSVRPLSPAESAALPELLPLVHAEFALSELGYFHGVTRSASNTRLAYDYCMGHAEWFAGEAGRHLLNLVARAVGAERGDAPARTSR